MKEQMICPFCLSGVEQQQTACPFCGASLENKNPSGTLPLGTVLDGRYTIGSYLSIDGEGVTYKAVDNAARMFVVIKEYRPVTLCDDSGDVLTVGPKKGSEVLFKTTRMDFAELYRTLQGLQRQPGLVQVRDVLEQNGTVYGVMEYMDGITLADYLAKRSAPLSPQETLNLLRPVLEAVSLLHGHGLIHQGICPQNIRITSRGEARLGGFATSGLRAEGGELKHQLYDGYSAPEQYSAAEFSGRFTDVYGIAAVIYRMVTGVQPAPAGERRISDSLRPAHTVQPAVPAEFSAVLQAAMRLDAAGRLQTVAELLSGLSDPEQAKEITRSQPKDAASGNGIPKQYWIIGGAVAAGVILALILLVVIFGGKGAPSSSSAAPSSSSASSQVTEGVPSFVGKKYTDVTRNSKYTNLYDFSVTQEFSDTVEEGYIISQDPKAGETLASSDNTIHLVVSKGKEEFTVPGVIGYTLDGAKSALNQAGIQNISVEIVDNDGSQPAGCVVETVPAENGKVSADESVLVRVAGDAPQPTATPEPTPTATPEPTAAPEPTPGTDASSTPQEPQA